MFDVEDTIVAISSAAGAAGRSIVRLSGERAGELADRVFEPSLAGTGGFRAVDGTVRVEGPWPVAAPARAYVFRAPRSYTRQDVIELHVPGRTVASVVREALIAAGARPAEAGEFTARAFLSGRLDLARAEAVADIIDAEADAQLRSAVGVLEGALARLCRPAAETLTEALALIESSIDFADEDIELCPPGELSARVAGAAGVLESAAASSGRWTAADAQPRVAIAGPPNAGKSSLLNALSGLDRAIVSALAGTTRDVLSAPARLAGGEEVLLLDAAGLGAGDDPMSQAAHAAAREAAASAEAVLFVFDATEADTVAAESLLAELRRLNRRARPIVVANKIDLLDEQNGGTRTHRSFHPTRSFQPTGDSVLGVSATRGDGLNELRRRLGENLAGLSPPRADGLLLHDRQRRAIDQAAASAGRAVSLLAGAATLADVAELAAVELRAALESLKELTGEVVTEDILSTIFARFCVGK